MRSRPSSARPAGARDRCCGGDGGLSQLLCKQCWLAAVQAPMLRPTDECLSHCGLQVEVWQVMCACLAGTPRHSPSFGMPEPCMGVYCLSTANPGHLLCMQACMWPTFYRVPVHDAAACLLRLHAGPESGMPPLC